MNKLFKALSFVAAIAFIASACTPSVAGIAQAAPAEVGYQAVLDKSLSDQSVVDFIGSNACASADSFYHCRTAGVAFWANEDQIVKSAYLYLNASDGFWVYQGDLPLTLDADDTMAEVETKLTQFRVPQVLRGGWDLGLPDDGNSHDHTHYWAIYKRFGVTVIYNSPDPNDRNATIHAILVE